MRFECLLRYPANPAARCSGYDPAFTKLCSVGAEAEGSTGLALEASTGAAVILCLVLGRTFATLTVFRDGESDRDSLFSVNSGSREREADTDRRIVGDRNTSEPLKIWLAEACVSSLAEGKTTDDPGSSRECT